jgi:hypothetical protein
MIVVAGLDPATSIGERNASKRQTSKNEMAGTGPAMTVQYN